MAEIKSPPARSRSLYVPVFPLELWDIIIEYLHREETVQSLSRLSQTCPLLHTRIEPLLYQPVRLQNPESGARLARTISSRPELAPLIREIQTKMDSGLEIASQSYWDFYQVAVILPSLEKLYLRRLAEPPLDAHRYPSQKTRALVYDQVNLQCTTMEELGRLDALQFIPPFESLATPGRLFEKAWPGRTLFDYSLLQVPTGLPALRVCHIWVDQVRLDDNLIKADSSIFSHPGIRKLCIAGAFIDCTLNPDLGPRARSTELEDLTLLNCSISPETLERLMQYPRGLRRFTNRSIWHEFDITHPNADTHNLALDAHRDTLEFMDLDIYWGNEDEADFYNLSSLKHLTTTLSTLVGRECEELDVEDDSNLPESLESFTLRFDEYKSWSLSAIYELVKSEKLPKLRRFTCEVPENMDELPSINPDKVNPPCSEICQEGNTWCEKFKELNVELFMNPVPYPNERPKSDLCTCENLDYHHRFPWHPHIGRLTNPWDDDDEFAESTWSDDYDTDDMIEHAQQDQGADDFDFTDDMIEHTNLQYDQGAYDSEFASDDDNSDSPDHNSDSSGEDSDTPDLDENGDADNEVERMPENSQNDPDAEDPEFNENSVVGGDTEDTLDNAQGDPSEDNDNFDDNCDFDGYEEEVDDF